MKYLGIDYGTKKIGLALSDDTGTLSFPYEIIPNNKDLQKVLTGIIKKEKAGQIVIGYSLNQKGEDNLVLKETKDFAKELKNVLNIPIHFEKEFFTSTFARQLTRGKGEKTARKIKQRNIGSVDAHAASLILQRFLDRQNKISI